MNTIFRPGKSRPKWMRSSPSSAPRGCLRAAEAWRLRARTTQAIALLCLARLLVAIVPLRVWRRSIGHLDGATAPATLPDEAAAARRLAVHVERAAGRLPFAT